MGGEMGWLMRREEGGVGFAVCGGLGVGLGSLLGVGSSCIDRVFRLLVFDVKKSMQTKDRTNGKTADNWGIRNSESSSINASWRQNLNCLICIPRSRFNRQHPRRLAKDHL